MYCADGGSKGIESEHNAGEDMKPKISVAMAVYNGRKYLREQIDSILSQTVPVDEIIIIDDHSPETARDIIEQYQQTAACEILFQEHEENKGYAQTFFDALSLTTGDYIFFTDQDDIWLDKKVENCLEEMEKHPEICCLSACNIMIDSAGKEFGREKLPQNRLTQINVNDLLKQKALRPGMTLAIRKILKESADQSDTTAYEAHDRFIEYLAAIKDGFFLLAEYQNKYRIHDQNTSGMNRSHFRLRSGKQGRIDQIDKEIRYLKLIRPIEECNQVMIDRLIRHYDTRKNLLKRGSILKYITCSAKIAYGYSTYKIWFGDLISMLRG